MAKTAKSKTAAAAAEQPDAPAGQAAGLEEMVNFTREMALLLLVYTCVRAVWHAGVPAYFGAQPFVPLVWPLAAAQAFAVLLFWVGGGFGGQRRERGWLLNIYTLLAMAVVGKCVLDAYIYHFQPSLWRHFSPSRPWGVPALLGERLPAQVLSGLEGRTLAALAQHLERIVDVLCLLSTFKGVRASKALMQARRALKRREAEARAGKKED